MSQRLKWVEHDPDEDPGPHPSEFSCQCESKSEFDLTISEGRVVLTCPECDKPLDLDGIGWWDEAPEMHEPVRVQAEYMVESTYADGPEPSYILLTPTNEKEES